MFKIVRGAVLTAAAIGAICAALPASAQEVRDGGPRFERDGGPRRHHRFDDEFRHHRDHGYGYGGPRFHHRFDDERRHRHFDRY